MSKTPELNAKALEAARHGYEQGLGVSHVDCLKAAIRAYLAALREAPVAVKALEWEPILNKDNEHDGDEAKTSIGGYTIGVDPFSYSPTTAYYVNGPCEFHQQFVRPEAAKAAAQADYETRIRSALTASPASHGVVTDAMAEKFSAGVAKYWQGRRSGRDGDAIMAGLSAALAPDLAERGVESRAISDIAAERKRQIEAEGWTPEHDDTHKLGELAAAAACYAASAKGHGFILLDRAPSRWPWSLDWWKPTTPRRDLVKAGALIAAEIDRLDRAAAPEQEKSR